MKPWMIWDIERKLAEDLAQDAFLKAFGAIGRFDGRSALFTWLYRIATNACLDTLAASPRKLARHGPAGTSTAMLVPEVPWLQPYPDELLDELASSDSEPDAAVVAKETIELAFLATIQYLPPKQRAVLILRDVLGWSANDTAALLQDSVPAVNSALQRARQAIASTAPMVSVGPMPNAIAPAFHISSAAVPSMTGKPWPPWLSGPDSAFQPPSIQRR